MLRWTEPTPHHVSDAVVSKLAQSLQVGMVSLGMEDLQDLAMDFHQQDEEVGRYGSPFPAGMAQAVWYFATDTVETQVEKLRRQGAISAILDINSKKKKSKSGSANYLHGTRGDDDGELELHKPPSRGIILYIRDSEKFLGGSHG